MSKCSVRIVPNFRRQSYRVAAEPLTTAASKSTTTTRLRLAGFVLELRKEREGLYRGELIHVDGAESPAQLIVCDLRGLEQSQLRLRRGPAAAQGGTAAARQLVALETRENFARTGHDRRRQTGQPCDLNAVA